ncbi:MAG: molybdopterin-synthase adenylyltransferase MoeB [Hyphomicrobiales bacterium]|nr:molybdopterin-synthase adenylyltransferase MoeB [Hyphomicrobiales bacterium]
MEHEALTRFSRQISLPGIGLDGQKRLQQTRVLVVGAGGLGGPVLQYLAAAGIGTLGIAEYDRVALSNLNRQILFETGDIGRHKVDAASDTLHALNPDISLTPHALRADAENLPTLLTHYDLVADCSDNFATRYAVHDACYAAGKPLVSAAAIGFQGQLSTYKAYLGAPHPCYHCLSPEPPAPEDQPSCAESGILGTVTGILGTWQANEILKEALSIGQGLSGTLLLLDALHATVRRIPLPRDPGCAFCMLE